MAAHVTGSLSTVTHAVLSLYGMRLSMYDCMHQMMPQCSAQERGDNNDDDQSVVAEGGLNYPPPPAKQKTNKKAKQNKQKVSQKSYISKLY